MSDLEKLLPTENCSICAHLYLDGPKENYTYDIKCIFTNKFPDSNFYCELFKLEKTNTKVSSIDLSYIDFLENCLKVSIEEYKKSIHWKLFKEYASKHIENKCSNCGSIENLELIPINKKLGRETLEDVKFLCKNCLAP